MAKTITVNQRISKEIEDIPLFVVKINGRFLLSIRENSESKVWKKIEKAIKNIK